MKKFISYFFILVLNLACLSATLNSCSSTESKSLIATESQPKSELEKFLESRSSSKTAVIKFYADWCGTCREYAPEFNHTKQTLKDSEVEFYEINVDKKEYSALIKELKVGLIPITYFVSKDRKTIENRIGFINATQLTEKTKNFILK